MNEIHCLGCDPTGCTPANPLGFGHYGHSRLGGLSFEDVITKAVWVYDTPNPDAEAICERFASNAVERMNREP